MIAALRRAKQFREIFGADTVVLPEDVVLEDGFLLYDLYAEDGDKLSLLAAAAAAEDGAAHAFSAALLSAAERIGLSLPPAENTVVVRGKGITAQVGEDVYFLGNKKAFREIGIPIPYAVCHTDFNGYTVLYAAKNAEFSGFFLFRKKLYPGAEALVQSLHRLGKRTVLLCRTLRTAKDCARLNIRETRIALLQREQEKVLQELQKRDRIWVVRQDTAEPICALLAIAERIRYPTQRKKKSLVRSTLEETDMFGKVNYTIRIAGMNCTHCSARVKTALESLRGVSADISLEEKLARVKCPASLDSEKLTAAVTDIGFTVVSIERV